MSIEAARRRYKQAAHAMQSAVRFRVSRDLVRVSMLDDAIPFPDMIACPICGQRVIVKSRYAHSSGVTIISIALHFYAGSWCPQRERVEVANPQPAMTSRWA